jgi:hypothetical protein
MAKGEAVTGRQAGIQFSWPHDEDGNPMALVTMQLSELVGLPNYSNVTVGPGSVTKFVKDGKDGIAEGLRECAIAVETILAEERQPVLEMVQGGNA